MTEMEYYRLEGKSPVKDTLVHDDPVSLERFAQSREGSKRIVAQDKMRGPDRKQYLVSTVFLGHDHNLFGKDGDEPILFETMVFKQSERFGSGKEKTYEEPQWRYHTWDDAEAGHNKVVVEFVRKRIPSQDLMPYIPFA